MLESAETRVSALEAELDALKAALKPFSDIGNSLIAQSPDDKSPWTLIPDNEKIIVGWRHLTVTAAQLRSCAFAGNKS